MEGIGNASAYVIQLESGCQFLGAWLCREWEWIAIHCSEIAQKGHGKFIEPKRRAEQSMLPPRAFK
jgi:hypothetical protein